AHHLAVAGVAKAADHAVSAAYRLDLEHGPLTWLVGLVEALGDNAVESAAAGAEPALGDPAIARGRGQEQRGSGVFPRAACRGCRLHEPLKPLPAIFQ